MRLERTQTREQREAQLERKMTSWQEWLYAGDPRRHAQLTHADGSLVTGRPRLVSPRDLPLQEVSFTGEFGNMEARLFVPHERRERAPLLVMLHGCGQTAEEFAAATAMAGHAESAGFIILYPAQCITRSAARCWNWFDPAHQHRGAGEPALLADAVCQTMTSHHADPSRVYVAGLSAGGAMAVTLGRSYPDIFAAVGSHSGLAHCSAIGPVAALDVMRHGPGRDTRPRVGGVPTIVFQGTRDDVVHPLNGRRIVADCVGLSTTKTKAASPVGVDSTRRVRPFTRTLYKDTRGRDQAEYWEVSGAGHAWSGGQKGARFSDPDGPDASREMLRFFQSHVLRPRLVA